MTAERVVKVLLSGGRGTDHATRMHLSRDGPIEARWTMRWVGCMHRGARGVRNDEAMENGF
jgi:hypothetical protein